MEAPHSPVVYSALHNAPDGDHDEILEGEEYYEEEEYDEMDYHHAHHKHKHEEKKVVFESFDFNDCESLMWRKVVCILMLWLIFLIFCHSTNFVDTFKAKEHSGQHPESQLFGSGF